MKPFNQFTEDDFKDLYINYDTCQDWIDSVAISLKKLLLENDLDYKDPRHDPNCNTCMVAESIYALRRYFANLKLDPGEKHEKIENFHAPTSTPDC